MTPAIVMAQRPAWRSKWIMSCLPCADAALRRAPNVIVAVDDVVGLDNYRSVMDAVVAAVFPELREPMARFYAKSGPALRDGFDQAVVTRFDLRLAPFVEAAAPLPLDGIKVALAVLRAG